MCRFVSLSLLVMLIAGCAAAPPPASPSAAPTDTPPTAVPQASATAAPTDTPLPPTASPAPVGEQEILFLRGGDLLAYGVSSRDERTVTQGVRAFAASPDGRLLALLRGAGRSGEIWVARRDGGEARQITSNQRAEASLSWAPNGSALVYSSSPADDPPTLDWAGWSRWCASAEVRIIALSDAQERTLADGCDPAFGPDGERIAFAAPPQIPAPELGFLGSVNAIRLINRQGQNGWNFASADGQDPDAGLLVYAPAWSPDGAQVAYQRFLGYQALVDLNISEIAAAFKGDGQPLASGAGWMLPPQFGPGGQTVALIEHNFSDARGGTGYEVWRISLVWLDAAGSMFLPSGEIPTVGSIAWQAPRVTAAAWSPDGGQLAMALPAGWSRDASTQDLIYQAEGPGEVWLWGSDGVAQERIIEGVDYASPLLWLPG